MKSDRQAHLALLGKTGTSYVEWNHERERRQLLKKAQPKPTPGQRLVNRLKNLLSRQRTEEPWT